MLIEQWRSLTREAIASLYHSFAKDATSAVLFESVPDCSLANHLGLALAVLDQIDIGLVSH